MRIHPVGTKRRDSSRLLAGHLLMQHDAAGDHALVDMRPEPRRHESLRR